MKRRKLVIAQGLIALLLMIVGIAGCSSVENEQLVNGQSANPLEDITNPSEGVTEWETKISDIPDYPEGSPVAGGMVRKVTANTLDLEVPTGTGAIKDGQYEPGTETKIVQVVFNLDTKVYRMLYRAGELAGKLELEELTLNDLEVGDVINVWGEESGDRIFADTIIIG